MSGTVPWLILDQGVPRDAALIFRNLGYACTHVGEIGMSKADDNAILAWAIENSGVVLTLDADFHMILAVSGARGPSVVRLRMEGWTRRNSYRSCKLYSRDSKRNSS